MNEIIEIVKAGQGNKHENTIKCTIPLKIVKEIGLERGDQLVWKYKENDDGEYTLTVKKLDL